MANIRWHRESISHVGRLGNPRRVGRLCRAGIGRRQGMSIPSTQDQGREEGVAVQARDISHSQTILLARCHRHLGIHQSSTGRHDVGVRGKCQGLQFDRPDPPRTGLYRTLPGRLCQLREICVPLRDAQLCRKLLQGEPIAGVPQSGPGGICATFRSIVSASSLPQSRLASQKEARRSPSVDGQGHCGM